MSKFKSIIVDLDGTLADCEHRRHFVTPDPDDPTVRQDWKSFFESMSEDPINKWCLDLAIAMEDLGYAIVLVTGRPEKYRKLTTTWLSDHGLSWDRLFMRGDGDYRSDDDVKEEIYHRDIAPSHDVLFVVDDRQKVVKRWRQLGLVCLQCGEGNY